MTDITNNFDDAIGTNPLLSSRWDAVKDKVLADARRAGLEVDAESLKLLPAIKMAVFTDMGLPSNVMQELATIPAVQHQIERREALAQLERGDAELQARLQSMSPDRRMSYARTLESQRPYLAPEPAPKTAEDEAKLLLLIRKLPPAERISAARAAGLC